MKMTVPALCTAGKAKLRALHLKAITTEHPLCAGCWGQMEEETGHGQGDTPPGRCEQPSIRVQLSQSVSHACCSLRGPPASRRAHLHPPLNHLRRLICLLTEQQH